MWVRIVRVGAALAALGVGLPMGAGAQDRSAGSARGASEPPAATTGDGVAFTEDGLVYTVRAGDTASHIAERFRVQLTDLIAWNDGLEPDRIREGQTLRIDNGLRRVVYTIQRGDTLASIAAHHEVQLNDIVSWNPRVRPNRIRAGNALTIYTHVPESRSVSIGTPQHGHLEHARRLPLHNRAIEVRYPERAYGTDETIRWIVEGFEEIARTHAHTPRVVVHDLSRRNGGELNGHHSHRSGRDADIAYYQRDCRDACRFHRIGPDQLDVARQWALFSQWLEAGRVEHIFVDQALAEALYRHARESGVSRANLARWFAYPSEHGHGIIRHHPRHADHFHVRFVCHDTDEECR
ncbi:MAG: penicillin-insensitive murein endopeptidase [Sandaracinaceae bacterium]